MKKKILNHIKTLWGGKHIWSEKNMFVNMFPALPKHMCFHDGMRSHKPDANMHICLFF